MARELHHVVHHGGCEEGAGDPRGVSGGWGSGKETTDTWRRVFLAVSVRAGVPRFL